MTEKQTHTAEDMYKFFKKKNTETDVTYLQFKYTLSLFNKKLADAALQGKTISLGSRLGKIKIRRRRRTFSNPRIDYNATKKLREQGIERNIYFTDEFYYYWAWVKKDAQTKNKSAYKFKPTGGKNGIRKKLSRLLNTDEFAHLNFEDDYNK